MKKTMDTEELRRKAEAKVAYLRADAKACSGDLETKRLLHELQVHQVELEMQNEELRQVIAQRDAVLEKYQELYDSAPAGYFNLDHVGIINEVNQTGSALLRVERSLLINNRLDDFISDETRPAFYDFLDKVFTNDTKQTCEALFVKQDHSPLFVQIEAIVSETRKNCRAVVIDITERKRSEKKLAEAKLRLEALMAAVPVGISFSHDITCQHITGNPAVLEQFNISSEDNLSASALDVHAPGRKVKFFLDGREISDAELPLQRAVSENKVIPPMELKVVMPSGKHWITKASGAPVRDTQGNIIGGISVTEDITELKQAEDALILLNEELEDRVAQRTDELRLKDQAMIQQNSMAALGGMINNIAHQWRQPLSVISLIIQTVQSRYASGALTREKMNSDIENVMENIMHMSETIEDFLNFFKQDKIKQKFFISEAVRIAISLVSASLENHNIKVEIKTEDDATAIGYQNEYSQVLLNIISNTCDACLEHSVPNPRIFICIAQENERSVLYIRDNCGGIPDEIISKIFDPYFTTRDPDKGTGIGLYMSKMIIEQNMNGHLTACNTAGGAEFRIEV